MGQSNEGDGLASISEFVCCACGYAFVDVIGFVISSLAAGWTDWCSRTGGPSAEGSGPVILVISYYYTSPSIFSAYVMLY